MLLVFHLVFVTREIPTSILIQLFPFCICSDRINLVIHFSPQITFVRLSTRVILLPGTVEECRCLPFSRTIPASNSCDSFATITVGNIPSPPSYRHKRVQHQQFRIRVLYHPLGEFNTSRNNNLPDDLDDALDCN